MSSKSNPETFVADGCERARRAWEPEIRRQVEAEFAKDWNESGFIQRWSLRWKIDAEIERRLDECEPPDALY